MKNIHFSIDNYIEFGPDIETLGMYPEEGMRGKITNIVVDIESFDPKEAVIIVEVDFSEFEDYNRQFETSNWYGVPHLGQDMYVGKYSARETGKYKNRDKLYLPGPPLCETYLSRIEIKRKT